MRTQIIHKQNSRCLLWTGVTGRLPLCFNRQSATSTGFRIYASASGRNRRSVPRGPENAAPRSPPLDWALETESGEKRDASVLLLESKAEINKEPVSDDMTVTRGMLVREAEREPTFAPLPGAAEKTLVCEVGGIPTACASRNLN